MTRKGSDRMLATNEEMQRMDLRAVEEGHVSMVQLMKQAADALFEALCPGLRHLYNHLRKSKTSNRLYLSMI